MTAGHRVRPQLMLTLEGVHADEASLKNVTNVRDVRRSQGSSSGLEAPQDVAHLILAVTVELPGFTYPYCSATGALPRVRAPYAPQAGVAQQMPASHRPERTHLGP